MSRPLMQYGVGQLEEIFSNSKADPKRLKQLEDELKYRQVPRAVALLTEVQAVMHNAASSVASVAPSVARPAASSSKQPELFEPAGAFPKRMAQPQMVEEPRPPAQAPSTPEPPTPRVVTIPIDDAYKLLKATPGSAWELVEQTRRLLVQQAHPSHVSMLSSKRRAQVEAEAMQVNAAYVTLSNVRCGK